MKTVRAALPHRLSFFFYFCLARRRVQPSRAVQWGIGIGGGILLGFVWVTGDLSGAKRIESKMN
jgi:hypothetical protein